MSSFVIANLGDAALTIPSGSVNAGGTLSTGGYIWVNNTSAAAITLTLTANMVPFVLIKDIAGNASTFPITIAFAGGIDNGTSTLLTLPYQWVQLAWNGASYSAIG